MGRGACAEPVVVREALNALRDGRPRLVGLIGEGGPSPGRTEGLLEYPMTCHSGGTLEIYVEPYLAKPLLVLVGHGPVVETLATLGRAAEYAVEIVGGDAIREELGRLALTQRSSVVVATHADSDEDALDQVLGTDAGYVSLVASRRRAAAIVERLKQRGVPAECLGSAQGARGARHRRADAAGDRGEHPGRNHPAPPQREGRPRQPEARPGAAVRTEARDPICGMRVEIATAQYRSEAWGRAVYFCCRRCQETFDRDPERHRARGMGAPTCPRPPGASAPDDSLTSSLTALRPRRVTAPGPAGPRSSC